MRPDPFRDQPVVKGDRLRLEPLGPGHFEGIWQVLNDPQGARDHDDRADCAIVRLEGDEVFGEVGLNKLDPDSARCNFFLEGRWVDTVVMGILRTDPRPRVAR